MLGSASFGSTAIGAGVSEDGIATVSVTLTGPMPSVAIYAYDDGARLVGPYQVVSATASPAANAAFRRTGPLPVVRGYGGVNVAVNTPRPVLSATATVIIASNTNITAPRPSVRATATTHGIASVGVVGKVGQLTAYSGAQASVIAPVARIASTGVVWISGRVVAVAPAPSLVATATQPNRAQARLTSPMPRLGGATIANLRSPAAFVTAVVTQVAAVTYEAYVLNLNHADPQAPDELTRYTNFPFDRIVRYKNSYFGMNATGLYLLEGTTDDGAAIPWEFKTHISDFGSPKLKTVQYAYFGGRLGPEATVSLSAGEKAAASYAYTTPRGQTAQNYRQVFGRGVKARYFSIGASGTDAMNLDALELDVTELSRRI